MVFQIDFAWEIDNFILSTVKWCNNFLLGLDFLVVSSSKVKVIFLFFLFLPLGFCIDYIEFTQITGREADWVEVS